MSWNNMREDFHLSDREIVAAREGLTPLVDEHLANCRRCRDRKSELEGVLVQFAAIQQERAIPPGDGPLALLKARMARERSPSAPPSHSWQIAAAALAAFAAGFAIWMAIPALSQRREAIAVPNPRLTPGATVRASRDEVCRDSAVKNRTVPVALRQKVFESYGIPNAEPRAYEVDYLITPALGGADNIQNLWPQPYASTVWNARVKDALEDHLRELVCEGKVDLPTAQREIATNWIQAYKKYFHTNKPAAAPE